MKTSPNPKSFVQKFLPELDSPEKIYDLFKGLGYPEEQILDPSYKRKISEFDFAKEEAEKVKDIYTVFNYDSKIQIFLIETKTLPTSLVRYLTKKLADRYLRFLLILTTDYKEYSFVFPEFEKKEEGKHKLKLTKLTFDRESPYHTDQLTLSNIALTGEEENWRDIWTRWKKAFSVEKVTDDFFEDYKRIFFELRDTFQSQNISIKNAHELSQQFLNRLMFLYFISKKRWLNNDPKYIKWFWERYREEKRNGNASDQNFYEHWLKIMFLEAFNNQYSHPSYFPQDIHRILADAPYLNGGLFSKSELDGLNFHVSDELFQQVLDVFEKYNFTIREDLPLDVEVAVDPKMIGYVYESLSNVAEEIYERQDLGIFYTPSIEVDFMCRRTVVEYLNNHLPELGKENVYKLLFDEDTNEIEGLLDKKNLWYKLEEVLDNLAVVDPACGSGAFLVGMLHILVELYKLTYEHIPREMTDFELKKKIIGNSLYGVDVMAWAVHSAELRLWLQLIIEGNIPYEDRKLSALLPNLNLKLRVGDSLVQEIGGQSLHMRDSNLTPQQKKKLTELKHEKEKFYSNDPTAKFKKTEAVENEELRVFTELLNEKIDSLRKEIQNLELEKRQKQFDMFEGDKKHSEQKNLFEKQIQNLNEEIEEIEEVKRRIHKPGKKPFVWDIDFVEIFGEKGGFDIVIGNPPYVRQEKVAPPDKLKSEVTSEEKKEYKNKLLRSIQAHFPFVKKIDKKSDYYIYFYFHGLSLLNEKGTFCFITSNSWLDVGYGKDLQEFLLKHCAIKAIYDNQAKRSFEHADVNTVISLFGPPKAKNNGSPSIQALENTARFVMFRRPFEEVLSTNNLLDIENAGETKKFETFRVFPISQQALLEEGWEYPADYKEENKKFYQFNVGKYEGNKWGGKYLRAPDIFFTILEKGKDKLVKLGDIADVRRGITTGCNEFFYLPSKHFKIKEDRDFFYLIPRYEGLPRGIKIENEFLKPVIKSSRECNSFKINPKLLKQHIFMPSSPDSLKSTNAWDYIKWGESKNFQKIPTTSSRLNWWNLGNRRIPDIISPCSIAELYRAFENNYAYADKRLYEIYPNNKEKNSLLFSLCSTLTTLFLEVGSRTGLGLGLLDLTVYELADCLVIHPKFLDDTVIHNKTRKFSGLAEIGIDPNLPVREQEPNPMADRKIIDEAIFDLLNLTHEEKIEVYWAVSEMVTNRLGKARSI